MVELFVRFEASQYKEMKSHENVCLAVLPMFHIYGLALFVFGLLSLGTSVVVMRKFDKNQVVEVINKYKVTHFPVVPPLLAILIAKAKSLSDCGSVSLSGLCSLKQVSCGAAPVTNKVIADFLDTYPGVDFIQVSFLFFLSYSRERLCFRVTHKTMSSYANNSIRWVVQSM